MYFYELRIELRFRFDKNVTCNMRRSVVFASLDFLHICSKSLSEPTLASKWDKGGLRSCTWNRQVLSMHA